LNPIAIQNEYGLQTSSKNGKLENQFAPIKNADVFNLLFKYSL